MFYRLIAFTLAAALLVGCGGGESATGSGSGSAAAGSGSAAAPAPKALTARETYDKFHASLLAKDGGAMYDLMSVKARKSADDQAAKMQEKAKMAKTDEEKAAADRMLKRMGVTTEELQSLTGRGLMIKMMGQMPDKILEEGKLVKVTNVDEKGDAATVTTKDGKDKEEKVPLVKEDGVWKIDRGF